MRPDKTAAFCAGLALTFLGSAAVAEVRISLSNDPNAGFAGELRSLLETERAALNATAPRAALGPDASPRRVQEAIRRLRLQLAEAEPPIGNIENERGRGYRFVPSGV